MSGSAVSNSFENFPTPVGRILFPRSPAIAIAAIVDFTCFESSGGVCSTLINFLALALAVLLIIPSSCVGIYTDVIILPLILSSRTAL